MDAGRGRPNEKRLQLYRSNCLNNFIWPEVSHGQEREIAEHAQVVLDAREFYEDATIAQMYDPDYDWLYPELTAAHHALDAAVEQAYGLEPGCDEKIMVER